MTSYLGRGQLSEHDPDPEERGHKIVPGHWVDATCTESDVARRSMPITVWSSYTDTLGEYGPPAAFTEWGSQDSRTPVLADLRHLEGQWSPCTHKIYVLDGVAE